MSGTQTVRYGTGSSWIEKALTGAGQCTNAFFGRDPAYGIVKECQLLTAAPPGGAGSIALNWAAPTRNVDGSALTDVTGYRIRYGTSATALTKTIDVRGATVLAHTISGLSPGTYYVTVQTVNSSGALSAASRPVTAIVQ